VGVGGFALLLGFALLFGGMRPDGLDRVEIDRQMGKGKKMNLRIQVALGVCLGAIAFWVGVLESQGYAQDWPQWRGPRRDGHVLGVPVPGSWPAAWKKVWQLEVGEGYSSPVVADGVVYLLSREGEDEVVRGISVASGKVLWEQRYPAPYEVNPAARAHGKGPKSTPVVASGKLVTLGISGILSCWSTKDGKRLWQHRFGDRFPETAPLYGTAMSPIVVGSRVIAHVGGHDRGALAAWDLDTGEKAWEWAGDGPAYTSPILVELHGKAQLITQSQRFCLGVDVASGRVLWQIPFTTQYDVNIVTPVVWRDLVIFSGFRRGTTAYRLKPSGEPWAVEEIWHNREVSMYMNSPVLCKDRLVGLAQEQRGQFFAMDPASGQIFWRSEPRQGENAALVVLGDYVLALTTGSELIAFDPTAENFKPLARWKVADSATWAHPIWTARGLLVKDLQHLTLWEPVAAGSQ
jgi:outer membrane protein assembly factor BamB